MAERRMQVTVSSLDSANVTPESSVYLVACCGPKLDHAAPAVDLYTSPLFTKSRTYAERRGRWFILSALHGLLDPLAEIEPYDVTLKKMRSPERRAWGLQVQKQMAAAGILNCRLIALAGAGYLSPLVAAGVSVSQPMKGLGIGKQLQWLNQENEK